LTQVVQDKGPKTEGDEITFADIVGFFRRNWKLLALLTVVLSAVTIRDTTERPETVECGSNVLAGCDADRIVEAARLVTETGFEWEMTEGYVDPHVSDKVVRYVLGNVGRRPLLDW